MPISLFQNGTNIDASQHNFRDHLTCSYAHFVGSCPKQWQISLAVYVTFGKHWQYYLATPQLEPSCEHIGTNFSPFCDLPRGHNLGSAAVIIVSFCKSLTTEFPSSAQQSIDCLLQSCHNHSPAAILQQAVQRTHQTTAIWPTLPHTMMVETAVYGTASIPKDFTI